MMARGREAAILGLGFCLVYTLLITGTDAITKLFAQAFAAPQLFALSSGLVTVFCLLADRRAGGSFTLCKTRCPRAMAVRVITTIIGTVAFFEAFRLLPFADVFLFIALIPLIAAVLSPSVLGERASAQGWAALCLGLIGMLFLLPGGVHQAGLGHLMAGLAVAMGALSMVASRFISRRDGGSGLSQVFYPNLGLMLVMGAVLPMVAQPMALADLAWIIAYSVLLFAARWVLVAALALLPAFVVTPLINLQFVWMVLVGVVFFDEVPQASVYAGAACVIVAGLWLFREQMRLRHATPASPIPAE